MVTRSLGLFGNVLDGIGDAISGIGDWIVNGFHSIIDGGINGVIALIMKLVYLILQAFFLIIDFIVLIFRKMCGLDTVQINSSYIGSAGSGEFQGDLALVLINSQPVIDVFISLLVVAVILLIVFTFIAIIRNQYNPEKSKGSNGPIIGKALKALFTFLFVPAICVMGIFVSNGLLRAVDGATRLNTKTSISGQIFIAAANSANRVTTNDVFWEFLEGDTNGINPNGKFTTSSSWAYSNYTARDRAALAINEAFGMKLKPTDSGSSYDIKASYGRNNDAFKHMQNIDSVNYISQYDYMDTNLVWVYYDLTKFNWLLAFVSCFFVSAALLVSAIGIVQRIYNLTLLFAISSPFVALMPLDDGKAFGAWRKKFIEETIVMYGTVLAVNFFFIITPLLQSIDLFGSAAEIEAYGALGCQLFNDIGHLLFIICGALMIKDSSKLLTGLITGNDKADIMERGKAMKGNIQSTVGNVMAPVNKYRQWKDRKLEHKANEAMANGGGDGSGGSGGAGGKHSLLKKAAKGVGIVAGAPLYLGAKGLVKGGKLAGKGLKSAGQRVHDFGRTHSKRVKDMDALSPGFMEGTKESLKQARKHGADRSEVVDKRIERADRHMNAEASQDAAAAGLADLFGSGGVMDQQIALGKQEEEASNKRIERAERRINSDKSQAEGAAALGSIFGEGGTMDQLEAQGKREAKNKKISEGVKATNEAKRQAEAHDMSSEHVAEKRRERKKRASGNTKSQDAAIAQGMNDLFGGDD